MKPKKWTDVYPHGTKEGDEEFKFFVSLARNPKYEWRSISAISKETGLTKQRVEQIINKYHKLGMVFQSPKNDEYWGYWERVPQELVPKEQKSISRADQDDRIKKSIAKDMATCMTTTGCPHCGHEGPHSCAPEAGSYSYMVGDTYSVTFQGTEYSLQNVSTYVGPTHTSGPLFSTFADVKPDYSATPIMPPITVQCPSPTDIKFVHQDLPAAKADKTCSEAINKLERLEAAKLQVLMSNPAILGCGC